MFSSNLLKMLEQLELVELTSILQTLFVRSQISHPSYSTVTSPQSQCPPDNLITFSLKYSLCCVQPLITQSHIVHFCPGVKPDLTPLNSSHHDCILSPLVYSLLAYICEVAFQYFQFPVPSSLSSVGADNCSTSPFCIWMV